MFNNILKTIGDHYKRMNFDSNDNVFVDNEAIVVKRDANNNANERRGLLDGNDDDDNEMSFLPDNTALEMKDMAWADKKKGD